MVCGDFNEDFGAGPAAVPRPGFVTVYRNVGEGECPVSRPPHKQAPDQTSGKGKVDYIFAHGTGVEVDRDDASRAALALSRTPCWETGEWPTDHGIEALTIVVNAPQAFCQGSNAACRMW